VYRLRFLPFLGYAMFWGLAFGLTAAATYKILTYPKKTKIKEKTYSPYNEICSKL